MSHAVTNQIEIDVEDLSAECQAAIDHYTDLVQTLGAEHPTSKQAILCVLNALPEEAQLEFVNLADKAGLLSPEYELVGLTTYRS